jgi:hypothetical protein
MNSITHRFDTCFFERYAKISLENLLGKRYASLINSDRPDLQSPDGSIGIEVTRAIRENKNVAHALINEIAGKPITDVESEDFRDIRKNGYAYGLDNEGWVGSLEYNYWALAHPMRRIISSKVGKVTSGFYGDFEEFGLYIFTKEDINDADVTNAIDQISELQYGKRQRYHKLFISQIQSLYCCDLTTQTYQNIVIDKDLRRKFYNEALNNNL